MSVCGHNAQSEHAIKEQSYGFFLGIKAELFTMI